MKIFYDYQIFYNQKFGGPSRYFIELYKNIIELKEDAKIFSPIHINHYLKDLKISEIQKGILLKKKFKLNFFFKFVNKFLTKKSLMKYNPNIIHPTYYDISFYKNFNKPKILTVYDLIHEKYHYLYNLKSNYLPKEEAIRYSDFYICPSKCTQKDLIEYYNIKEEQTSVIYWAPFIKKKKKTNLSEFSRGKPYLLYVGNRHKYKNVNFMMKTISSSSEIMKNYNIIFFGGGNFRQHEKEFFKRLNFSDNQIILVHGRDQNLINLYHSASALIYPSLYEGLGLPILEAMNCNCPVITSYTSGMIEAGGNAVEYFDPQKNESLLEAIKNVLFSETRKKELVNLGKERIKLFSWEKCSKETLNIYKMLC